MRGLITDERNGDLRDVNDSVSDMVFITGTPYYWSDLPAEAREWRP
jgi:hypothetical protein